MIGNQVRIFLMTGGPGNVIEAELRKLDAAGATIYEHGYNGSGRGTMFIPMHRIDKIIDLGRVPR